MSIDKLPNEIQLQILSYTDRKDHKNLRLVNHVVGANATRTMIHEDRIQRRSDYAKSPELPYDIEDMYTDLPLILGKCMVRHVKKQIADHQEQYEREQELLSRRLQHERLFDHGASQYHFSHV